MAKFNSFEEIKAWQMGRELVKEIYGLTKNDKFTKDHALRNQMQRSAISIVGNIAEGFERYSNKEFTQFLVIAKASAGEVRSYLYVAKDLGYIKDKNFDQLLKECNEVAGCIHNLIRYLKRNM